MRTCLVGAPADPHAGLHEVAENLLMFDCVGIRAMDGESAAGTFEQIPLPVLDELVETGALVLAIRTSYPVVFQGGSLEQLPEPLIRCEEFHGYKVGTMTTTPGSRPFADAFEERARRFLPQRTRELILTQARIIELNDQALMDVSKADMENGALREKALYSVGKARLQPPRDLPAPQLFSDMMATLKVMNANWTLAETGLGYSVVEDSFAEPMVRAKLQSVFQPSIGDLAHQAFRELLDINDLPSVETMLRTGSLTWAELMRLRRAEGKAFRAWFQDVANRPVTETKEFLRDYTQMLASAGRGTPLVRRASLFLLEQAASVFGSAFGLGPSLGIAASAVNSLLLPSLPKASPYMLFDFLKNQGHRGAKRR